MVSFHLIVAGDFPLICWRIVIRKPTKYLLRRFFPSLYLSVSSRRASAHSRKLEQEWGCATLTHKLLQHYGPRVQNGPFYGLEFPPSTFDRHLAPKLLGSYECELIPVWQKVLSRSYAAILNVGSAEGYYVVGLAQHFSKVPVYAFDTDSWATKRVQEMAKINQVRNVSVHGACTAGWLSENLRSHSFILSDCEGYEDVLFRPDAAASLRHCD